MRKEWKRNYNNDKHKDKDTDVMNDCHISSNYLPSFLAHRKFLSDIILPKLRTCASFVVTSVSRVASIAMHVRTKGIAGEGVHVTNGW